MDAKDFKLIHEKLDRLDEKATAALKLLNGGDDPAKGIVVRLDRAEQTLSFLKKGFWACVGAILSSAAGLLFGHIPRH